MRNSTRFRRRRGGYTLIELSAVVAATSAVLLIAASTIKLAVDVQGRNQGRANEVRAVSGAAEAFRADVHAAERIEIEDGKPGAWRLVLGEGHSAEYSSDADRLIRREMRGEKIVSTREFELPRESAVTVAEKPVEGGTLVVMTIDSSKLKPDGMAVAAILGHDRRFLKQEEKP